MSSNGLFLAILFAFLECSVIAGNFPESKYYNQNKQCTRLNEMWYDVKPNCAVTCDAVGEKCPVYNRNLSGCACQAGFHRNGPKATDPCVSTEKCLRQRCQNRPNEIFKFCEQAAYCEPTCGVADDRKCERQTLKCPEECQCEDGFKRDPRTKSCIPSHQCPTQTGSTCTGANEVYRDCGNKCNDECPELKRKCNQYQKCVKGCYCAENHKRMEEECYPDYYCYYYYTYLSVSDNRKG